MTLPASLGLPIGPLRVQTPAADVGIRGWDHIELWVANAKQAAHFWRTACGFRLVGYSGLETGNRERASYALVQGRIRLVVSAPYGTGAMAEAVARHGDTVRGLALQVDDVETAYSVAVAAGAEGVQRPTESGDTFGVARTAAVRLYGDVVHTFVDRGDYAGPFLPGYRPVADAGVEDCGLAAIDHVAACVELGTLQRWVDWYHRVLGFQQIDLNNVTTEYSALMSRVMSNRGGRLKFPLNEPTEGTRRSQIQEFLDYHDGPGVQHLALVTRDIVGAVRKLRANGMEFLHVPREYYEDLPARVGHLAEPIAELAELGILADRDDEGYLLQIFAKPVQDRPTLFLEIIQRRGSRGFGAANVKALFESLERAQAERGNL